MVSKDQTCFKASYDKIDKTKDLPAYNNKQVVVEVFNKDIEDQQKEENFQNKRIVENENVKDCLSKASEIITEKTITITTGTVEPNIELLVNQKVITIILVVEISLKVTEKKIYEELNKIKNEKIMVLKHVDHRKVHIDA